MLMPMGFCAILGGTVTMVGSSPLILLNDLILTSNRALPATQQMETWGLFSVTPIGVVLLDEKLGLHLAFGRSEHFGGQVGPAQVGHVDPLAAREAERGPGRLAGIVERRGDGLGA